MQQTQVRLKLELNDEVRRVTLLERSFQCLQKQVCQLFSFQDLNFTLKYKDDEGDLVTISSEEEFQEALGSLQQNLLRLKITKLNKEKQEGTQERGGRCGRFRKFMEFKKWKEAQRDQENDKEDKQEEEEGEEEESKPWKRFFMFKSPHGPQHPHHHFHQRPHHFHHRHHERQEGEQEENRQHPFFPPRFGPHHPHHFRHHHRPQHQTEKEEPNFFAFPPRFGPHHPHHFHRHHHQQEETPKCRFGPRHGPFGIFGRPHHQHQQEQQEQKEEAQTFDFLENLGNLAKNLFGGVLNEDSTLEELFENDLFKVEHNYICDGCDEPISGTRHHCTECPDFDFCSSCFETKLESHAQHKFEKVSPFEALKQALQNGQHIDAFLVKRDEEAINEEVPKKQEESKSETQSLPQEPEQPKQEEITTITTNVEVPQPTETTNITVEPSTTISQPPTENPSEEKPKEEVVVYPFQKKLEDLEVMGFSDRKKNILTLLQNKGDLELTIEQLLN